MKIELTYDPVAPELIVKIDDQFTDGSDIFGFLYPVRNCILQTWLEPSGSWPGFVDQLRDLSRGEDIQLSFRGRRCDYEDLVNIVYKMDEVTTSFVEWEPVRDYKKRLQDIRCSLSQLLDTPAGDDKLSIAQTRNGFIYQFPEEARKIQMILETRQPVWYGWITCDKDFVEADRNAFQCCIVTEDFFDSYEQLNMLTKLTRAMRRSQDMICCCFTNEQMCKDYAAYAKQYGNMKFRFESGNESNWEKALYNKYGIAYEMNQNLSVFHEILREIEKCYAQGSELIARRESLVGSGRKSEQDLLKQKCAWLRSKEVYYKNAVKLLLENPAEIISRKELVHFGK